MTLTAGAGSRRRRRQGENRVKNFSSFVRVTH
jgi:hypothetical protein